MLRNLLQLDVVSPFPEPPQHCALRLLCYYEINKTPIILNNLVYPNSRLSIIYTNTERGAEMYLIKAKQGCNTDLGFYYTAAAE